MAESTRSLITAVLPAYNEAITIGEVLRLTRPFVSSIVVVDDGSTDQTASIAAGTGAEVIRHATNLGYGSALASGFRHVRDNGASLIVVLDADGQHNPRDIPELVKPILEGQADIVIGSRFLDRNSCPIPRYRRFGIGIVNRAWKISSKKHLTDTQCGFRAFSRAAIDAISISEQGMSASLEILDEAERNKLRIVEVPVSVRYNGDSSTISPSKHGMELMTYVLRKLRQDHPLLILGGCGSVLTIAGAAFGIYSLGVYMRTGNLPLGPTVISVSLTILGVLLVIGSLILNSIQVLSRRLENQQQR